MIDPLPISANQPLGHHQPLGTQSLGVVNLAYFFPAGLPDIEPIDEAITPSTETASLHRKVLQRALINTKLASEGNLPNEHTFPGIFTSENTSSEVMDSSGNNIIQKYRELDDAALESSWSSGVNPAASADQNNTIYPESVILDSAPTQTVLDGQSHAVENQLLPQKIQIGETLTSFISGSQKSVVEQKNKDESEPIASNSGISISQPETKISPMLGMQAHAPLNHDHLPVIVNFSTPPAPLQSQRIIDDNTIKTTNLSPEKTEIKPSLYANSQRSESLFQPDLDKSESLPPKHSQGITETSPIFSSEPEFGHADNPPISTNFSEVDSAEITSIQKSIESSPETSVFKVSDSRLEFLNDDTSTEHESFLPEILVPKLNRNPLKKGDSLPSENVLAADQNSVFSEAVSKAHDLEPESIQRTSQDRSAWITEGDSSFFAEKSLDSENASAIELSSCQETQEDREINTRPSTEKSSSSTVEISVSTPSIDLGNPSSVPIQRTREESSILSEESIAEPTLQAFKATIAFQNVEDTLPEQPPRENNINSTSSTDPESSTSATTLDTNLSTRAQSLQPNHVQRASEESSVPAKDIESLLTAKDSFSEPASKDQTPLSSPLQKAGEQKPDSSLAIFPRSTLPTEIQTKVEDSILHPLQEAYTEQATLPLNKNFTPNIAALRSGQIQPIDEPSSTLSVNTTGSESNTIDLGGKEQPDIQSSPPMQLQASEEISVSSPDTVSLAATTPLATTPLDIEESVSEQIQKSSKGSSLSSTNTVFLDTLDTLPTEPWVNIDQTSLDQSQTIPEASPTLPTNTVPIPTVEALEDQSLAAPENLSSQLIQKADENYYIFPTEATSESSQENSLIQTYPTGEALRPDPVQMPGEVSSTYSVDKDVESQVLDLTTKERSFIQDLSPDKLQKSDADIVSQTPDLTTQERLFIQDSSPDQLQRVGEDISDLSTDVTPASTTTYLAETPLDTEGFIPNPIQRLSQNNFISSANTASTHSEEKLGDEPLVNTEQVSFEPSQKIREVSPTTPTNTASISAIIAVESQSLAAAENLAFQPIQKVAENDSTCSTEITPEQTIEVSSIQAHPSLETLDSDQLQSSDKSYSASLPDTNLVYHPGHLAEDILTDIETTSSDTIQKTIDNPPPLPTDLAPLSTNITLGPVPVTISEKTSFEQIQQTSQASHTLPGIEPSPKTNLVSEINLDTESTSALETSSPSQIQHVVEKTVIFPDNNLLGSKDKLPESKFLEHIERNPPHQIQRASEESTHLSSEALSDTALTPSVSQEPTSLVRSSGHQIQSASEKNVNASMDSLSVSSKLGSELNPKTDIGDKSKQQIQRTVETNYLSLIDSFPEPSDPDLTLKTVSSLSILPPNYVQKSDLENSFPLTDNFAVPVTLEFQVSNSRHNTSFQAAQDSSKASSQHTDLSGNTPREVSSDSQSIVVAESLLPNQVQRDGGNATISTALFPLPSELNTASEGLESEYAASVEISSLKQIQKTSQEDYFHNEDAGSAEISTNVVSGFLPSIEEKTLEKGSKSTEKSSDFLSHIISEPKTIAVNQQINATKSGANELTSPDFGASFNLEPNHSVIQQHQQTLSSSEDFALQNIQLQRDFDLDISSVHLSQSFTSFLRPEILPDSDDTPPVKTITPSWNTPSSNQISSLPSPTADPLKSDVWRTTVGNTSDISQGFSQVHLVNSPNSKGVLSNSIQRTLENKNPVRPDTISSTSLEQTEPISNFESVQSYNIQTSENQSFSEGSTTDDYQEISQKSIEASRSEALLPSQIQRFNEIDSVSSRNVEADLEIKPVLDYLVSQSEPRPKNLPFCNIQRTLDSHFEDLTNLSTTNPNLPESEHPKTFNKEQLSTQHDSIYGFRDSALPSSDTSSFPENALDSSGLFPAANTSSHSIQRLSEDISDFTSNRVLMPSNSEAPSRDFLKAEELASETSLARKTSATNAISSTVVDDNAIQAQRIDQRLDQKAIDGTINPLSNHPEYLTSLQDLSFNKPSLSYEALPVVIDFQAPVSSLQRNPEFNQQAIENLSEIDISISQKMETGSSLSHDYDFTQNQDVLIKADPSQNQQNLDIARIQLSSNTTPTIQPQADLAQRQQDLDIARIQSSSSTRSTIQSKPDAPSILLHSETDPLSPISDTDSEVTKQAWLSQNAEPDLSTTIQSPDLPETMVQCLADKNRSALPEEWQNLAALVASQVQNNSTQNQSINLERSKSELPEETTEKYQKSSITPRANPASPSTDPIQRRLSVPRSKPVKFRHQTSIQAPNSPDADLPPRFLIQAKEDTPFTTIEANQNHASADHADKIRALEQLAQEIYYRMRQRLIIDKERHGRLYDKRLK